MVLTTVIGIRLSWDQILTVISDEFIHGLGLKFLLDKNRITIATYLKYYFQD